MKPIKLGLLALYAGLYDEMDPSEKYTYRPFIDRIVEKLSEKGAELVTAPVCVYEADIEAAVKSFEDNDAAAIVILFLAYHPSLVSAGILTKTRLPLIFLDTTECYEFGAQTDPAMINRCHGIHGVQDLCCVLRRLGKKYFVEAGHYEFSNLIERTIEAAKACIMTQAFKKSRVGIIGEPFKNMGDFAFAYDELERLTGIKTVTLQNEEALTLYNSITQSELEEEERYDRSYFTVDKNLGRDLHYLSLKSGLAVRNWIEKAGLHAFTSNFLDYKKNSAIPIMPFAAACKLMKKGYGYAGEGDILTAALVGALMKSYPETTFSEMFCPDWRSGRVFMSHMGEANSAILKSPHLFRKDMPYTPDVNGGVTVGVSGVFMGGHGVLVDLSPQGDGTFSLILAPCEIIEPQAPDKFQNAIRGWLKPELPLEMFLKRYSELGGTHHNAICYGADINVLSRFGELLNWKVEVLCQK